MNLRIDPELEALIPPLTPDERLRLRESIAREGRILDPIKVWQAPEGLTIIDGHNRYDVWLTLADEIPEPAIQVLDLADRQAVVSWMKEFQRGRRNLSRDQKLMMDLRDGVDVKSSGFGETKFRISQAKTILQHDPEGAARVIAGPPYTLARVFAEWLKRKNPKAFERKPRVKATAPPPPATPPALDNVEEHRLKVKLSSAEREKSDLLKRLTDQADQIEILKFARALDPLPPIVLPKKQPGSKQRRGVPVMLCSDWHVEEPVDPKTVNGLNEYNLDIADACITRLAEAFEWLSRDARYDCRQAVVWLGGDLLSGYIHEELVEKNFLSPPQAVAWLLPRIETMLRTIAKTCPQFERILVPMNDGNHGRNTDKIRVSTRTANSLEWLLYHTLADRLSDDLRFECHIAEGEWTYLDVCGKTLAFTHGDSFRYGGGVGGVSIPLRRGVNEVRKYRKVDYVSLGHFHCRQDFGDIAVNGSMIGVSPYSIRIHAPPEPRQQSWFLIDEDRGKCLSAPIWL